MSNFLTNPFIIGGILLGVGVYLLLKNEIKIGVLTASEAQRAIDKAEESADPFLALSKELVDEEEVEEELKSLLDR